MSRWDLVRRLRLVLGLTLVLGVVPGAAPGTDSVIPGPYDSTHGTAIEWADSPERAAAAAKASGKLLAVLHLAGELSDPGLT